MWPALAGTAATLLLAAGLWAVFRPAPPPQGPALVPGLSIVVLPFANLSGDPAQDYLADVITNELTTRLSRIRGSFVIARSTAFTYKGRAVGVKEVGRELGVRYVLEGSAQQSGDHVRVNAQLISAETGAHLWANQFDTGRADLLTMQDEIVTRLARSLEIEPTAIEASRVARARPGNLDAEDLAMRCQAGFYSSMPESAEREAALTLCERALQLDSRNVVALNTVAWRYITGVGTGLSTDPKADIQRTTDLVARALALEPDSYWAHLVKANLLLNQKRPDEALVEAERSRALNPSFIEAYSIECFAHWQLAQPEKTIEVADSALRLSPRDRILFIFYWAKALAYSMLNESTEAFDMDRRALVIAPQFSPAHRDLAAHLALNGQLQEARAALQRYLSLQQVGVRTIAQAEAFLNNSDNPVHRAWLQRYLEGLRKAGLPEQ